MSSDADAVQTELKPQKERTVMKDLEKKQLMMQFWKYQCQMS
jgi:hypothetical protein